MGEVGGPFAAYETVVREEWLDYNGHMHDASYGIVFSDANEVLFDALGLSIEYREQAGAAYYTVDGRIRYLAECSRGQRLRATTILVAADAKRIRLYTELVLDSGEVAATGEHLYLHVDAAAGATAPLPPDRQAAVDAMVAAHADLPRPPHLGLGVGARPIP